MRTIKGYPTKKSIAEMMARHGLRTSLFDSKSIAYSGEHQNEAAMNVCAELKAEGFEVDFSAYKRNTCCNGQIKLSKVSS